MSDEEIIMNKLKILEDKLDKINSKNLRENVTDILHEQRTVDTLNKYKELFSNLSL